MHGNIPPGNIIYSSGVDWLTATVEPGHKQEVLGTMAEMWVKLRAREGFTERTWVWQGYIGSIVDGISVGHRSDGTIVRLSGDMASLYALDVVKYADNVSRIDLQITLLEPERRRDWTEILEHWMSHEKRVTSGHVGSARIVQTPEGRTYYLGSRRSERYYRVYDKYAESSHQYPDGSWRWEIEYKRERAYRVAQQYARANRPAQECRELIARAWSDFNVELPCEALPSGWKDQRPKRPTDDEKRLEWIRHSIRPMIETMLMTHDPNVLLTALGLGAYADTPILGEIPLENEE